MFVRCNMMIPDTPRIRKPGILRILYWSINQKSPLALAQKRHKVTQSVIFITAKVHKFGRSDVR